MVEASQGSQGRRTIGRYTVESLVGSGSMGVVYKARDPKLDRVVAIKVLRQGLDATRLTREAQALAKLAHRNVVAVYDAGTDDDMFIAMEYVDGETFGAWLTKGARERPAILSALVEAGRGLAAAHAAGLVHRDFKPDNVFVARDGRVLVGDFGLVGSASTVPDSNEGQAGEVTRSRFVGTPAYMAPEQADGEATASSDQFSFCVTAWEAFVGRRPFAGETSGELLANARAGAIVEPTGERALPRRLGAVLRRGLDADPARRFGSMDALLAELAPQRRTWVAIAATVVLTGAAVAATTTVMRGGSSSPAAALLPCGDDGALIASVWNPTRRAEVQHALQQPGAEAGGDVLPASAIQLLDNTATTWAQLRHSACAEQRKTGRELFEQRAACFARMEADLDAVANTLVNKKTLAADDFLFLDTAFPVKRCMTRAGVVVPPPPARAAEVGRIRAVLAASQVGTTTTDGLAALEKLLAEADLTRYDGVVAEVAAVVAEYAYRLNDYAVAEKAARHAIEAAERQGNDVARAHAAATLAKTLARQTNQTGADEQLAAAQAAWERSDKDPFTGVVLANARAEIARVRNAPDAADHQKHLVEAMRAAYGPQSLSLAAALIDLSSIYSSTGAPGVQAALDEAMAIYKVDSAAEADVAWAIANANRAGKDLPRVIEAAKQYAAVVERHLDRGIEPADAARAYSELAIQLELATRWPEAIAANQRGLALLERARDGEPQLYFDLLLGLGIVQLENGEATTAIGTFEKAKKLVTAKFPAAADRSALDANLGRAYVAADRPKDAIPLLEPLVEPLRDAGAARRKAFGLVAASLARALWEKGGARDEARDLARDAVTAFSATLDDFKNDPTRAANARLVKGYLDETKKWLEARAK